MSADIKMYLAYAILALFAILFIYIVFQINKIYKQKEKELTFKLPKLDNKKKKKQFRQLKDSTKLTSIKNVDENKIIEIIESTEKEINHDLLENYEEILTTRKTIKIKKIKKKDINLDLPPLKKEKEITETKESNYYNDDFSDLLNQLDMEYERK